MCSLLDLTLEPHSLIGGFPFQPALLGNGRLIILKGDWHRHGFSPAGCYGLQV